ncbi:hypothetical protein KRR39_08305 [Nocardioides panacis]|uniref:Fibronectin type-III domain-containing protein n=1 Tax=Nocardioides panacis TaxID=2849501 RepID=A0A975Y1P5_9ACTN|nr:hypothetical protein [Nocardioides panacis]QWZ09726.1 hypothetical protein KRR39_08305 [Nocardioides panacis]
MRNVASRLLTAVLVAGIVATVTSAPGVAAPRLVSAALAEGAPAGLATYPTANGLGVSWDDSRPEADRYRLERHRDAGGWTELVTLPRNFSTWHYAYGDHDVAPGEHVTYRVTPIRDGVDGPAAQTEATRPTSVPVQGAQRLMAYRSSTTAPSAATVRDGVDGATVTSAASGYPAVTATTADGTMAQLYLSPLPGPGTYRFSGKDAGGDAYFSDFGGPCGGFVDRVLAVRSVLYDDTAHPVVLDASWTGRCKYGQVVRMEVRLGADTAVTLPTTTPASVGPLRTYAAAPLTRTVTINNPGPETLTLAAASTQGPAATDWTVVTNGCANTTLAPGATCPVTTRFTPTTAGTRTAALEVVARDDGGSLAPVTVLLDGFGTVAPGPLSGTTVPGVEAMLPYWNRPADDGGETITSYDIERMPRGGAWAPVGSVPADEDYWRPSYVDRTTVAGTYYTYRVRATNAAGTGPWTVLDSADLATSDRAVIVSGSRTKGSPRGLFQVADSFWAWYAPVVPLTQDPDHDYRYPATSPGGGHLVASRSTGPDGSDGEYDLWGGTPSQPATRQLTSMTGAETDADYSPGADRIAFTQTVAGHRSVWTIPAGGGTPTLLRDNAASPTWTADGTAVVVQDASTTGAPLLRINPDTGTVSAVAGTAGGTDPEISRDGNLAYVASTGQVMQIAAGQTNPTVLSTPDRDRALSAPSYSRYGTLFTTVTRTSTGENDPTLTSRLAVAGDPTGLLGDQTPPWVDARGLPQFLRGPVSFTVVAGDYGATPDFVLRPECRLDDGAWFGCLGAASLPALPEGRHTLYVRVTDETGRTTTNSFVVSSDTVAPALQLRPPTATDALAGRAPFSWNATDAGSGTDFFDVSVRTATPTTTFTGYRLPAGWAPSDIRSNLSSPLALGAETCVRVRARDQSGLYSSYLEQCVGRPLDDRSLTASAGWRRSRGSTQLAGTETVAARKGVSLATKTSVQARRIGVLATTCRNCGSVKVYIGTRYLGTVRLTSTRTQTKQLRYLPLQTAVWTGRVTLRTTSAAPVRVDGLLLRRT